MQASQGPSQGQRAKAPRLYYPGLDILKFVLAFFVLAEHVPIMSSLSGISLRLGTALLSPSVDIFYAISGFLCVDSVMRLPQNDRPAAMEQRLLKSSKTILLLYVAWALIYFPLNVVLSYAAGDFSMSTVLPWMLNYVRIFIFSGMWIYAPHLWYLLALGLGFLILYWCVKRKIPIIWVFVISVTLNAIGSVMPWLVHRSSLIGIVYWNTFADTRNVVFNGMLYICIGVLLAIYREKLHIPLSILWTGTVASFVGLVMAHGFAWTICAMMFVAFTIWIAVYHRKARAFPRLRLVGVVIYLLHVYVLKTMQFIIPRVGFVIMDINVTCMIFASICSLLLASAILPLIRRYSLLRFLFHG